VIRRLALASILAGMLCSAPAAAECTSANAYSFAFNSRPAATLSYTGSYSYTATTPGGASQSFTTSFATNTLSSSTVNTGGGNIQMPAIGNLITGASTGNTLNIGGAFTARTDTAFSTRFIRVTFSFATPIRTMSIRVHDIDFSSDQYRDWLAVEGSNGSSTYIPTLSAPAGTSATLIIGSTTPNTTYPALTQGQALGTATSNNTNTNAGDLAISFAEPVTSVTLKYGNYPYTGREKNTGQQAFGISTIGFCPMPSLSITKSSAPLATTGEGRFNVPSSDLVYTITATNTGGSPVDLNGLILTDALPTQGKFYNADFDTAQPGTEPFLLTAGSSGVTVGASNVAYSSNGSTYGYTPAAGYDANVKAFRITPTGSLAANSSFTIKYRVQIK
jgi:hypothetical protein